MKNYKLTIDLLPKGAWGNDFSKTLSKKDWDILRNKCYERANHKCAICGYVTDELDAHEVWNFNIENKTQTLLDIIALCSRCHGVKHIRNSYRLGYGEDAKTHFIKVNNASELGFIAHLTEAEMKFEEQNKVYRWKIVADLNKFGGQDIEFKQSYIPMIKSPYENIDFNTINFADTKNLFTTCKNENTNLISTPKVTEINVDNYQGIITIKSLFTNKIEWFLDETKIKTKYNLAGLFTTEFSVKNLTGKQLYFKLTNSNGEIISKPFNLY